MSFDPVFTYRDFLFVIFTVMIDARLKGLKLHMDRYTARFLSL